MNSLIILVIVAGLFGILVLIPSSITLIRASRLGAKISFSQAFGFTMRKTNRSDFFKGLAGFQKNKIDLALPNLEAHFLAGGNLLNCLDGYLYAKEKGLDVDFRMLSAIDLSGKSVLDSLQDSDKEYYLRVDNVKNDKLSIDFIGHYKYSFPNVFLDKDEEKVKNKVTEKLQRFIDSWNQTDPIETQRMILENILNTDFWEGNLKIVILKQDITIRPR